MRTNWSASDTVKADRMPPRLLGDLVLSARKGLVMALAIFCLVAAGLIAAAIMQPAEYRSSAGLLLTPGDGDFSQVSTEGSMRSALVDEGVATLNSPALAERVREAIQKKSPQAGKPALPLIRANRRDQSYIVDVVATAPNPADARMVADTAIDVFRNLQLDQRLGVRSVRTEPAPQLAATDPNEALLRLETEKAGLLAAASAVSAAPAVADDSSRIARELAQARADVAAMKALARSEVTVADIAKFRASGAPERLGDAGPAFTDDLSGYEAALAADAVDPAKADDAKFRKYKILTAASQIQPSLDAQVLRLAAAAGAIAPPKPPAQSPDASARLADLDRQIAEQRKLAAAWAVAPPAPQPAATVAAAPVASAIDVRVVSRPGPGVTAAWREPLILYPAAVGIALVPAMAFLLFVVLLSNTIINPRDAAALAGAPLLAVVSRITPTQLRSLPPGDRHPANYPMENPASPFADAMRATLAALRPAAGERSVCIAVAGAQVGDGASTISLALARTAAAAGVRVLLIDTDFADAGLTKAMGIEPAAGIEAILGGHRQLADLVVEDHMTSVHLLPCAPSESSRGALSLTQLTAVKAMLASAKLFYDMIIVDCQPHSTRARTRSMARMADIALIVAAFDATRRDVMSGFARRIQHNGTAVRGVVLNLVAVRSRREGISFLREPATIGAAGFFAPAEPRPGFLAAPPPRAPEPLPAVEPPPAVELAVAAEDPAPASEAAPAADQPSIH